MILIDKIQRFIYGLIGHVHYALMALISDTKNLLSIRVSMSLVKYIFFVIYLVSASLIQGDLKLC